MEKIYEYDVFLSFASEDESIARNIWQELSSSGLRVFWSDENLKKNIGKSFFSAIQSALTHSKYFVLLCTEASMKSNWVREEYEIFFSQCYIPSNRVRRLVILLSGTCYKKNIPTLLKNIQTTGSTSRLIKVLGGIEIKKIQYENIKLKNYVQELEILFNKKSDELNELRSEKLSIKLDYERFSKKLLPFDDKPNVVPSALRGNQYKKNCNILRVGMSIAIELIFKNTLSSYTNDCLEVTEEHIFKRVHQLLEGWVGITTTTYASIYKYKEKHNELVMTSYTYTFLKSRSNFNKHRFPTYPLVFDVDPKSKMATNGLTRKTWAGDERSLVSINIGKKGSTDCKNWWNNAVGTIDRGRYFVGTKILNKNKTKKYGVLTINGSKPGYFVAETLWEILPLLETLSDELGKHLEILYEKHENST